MAPHRSRTRIVDIDYDEILHETHLAVLFVIDSAEVWLPKNVIEVDQDNKQIAMPERLAIQKELV